ncbi:MAG: alpha/beta hydrolase [Armatimonadota bacterium]
MKAIFVGLMLGALAVAGGAGTAAAQEPARPTPVPLWPGGAPGAVGQEAADVPTLAYYPAPKDRNTGAAVVVCPGGGYGGLAEHEGHPVAVWLNSIGVNAVVLRYRHAPRYRHPVPLQDAARAVRTVRARAAEQGIDPQRIGILGFSAGGHLASTLSTHFDAGKPGAEDPIERQSSRPDFSILIYPVISLRESFTHAGSRNNLLGPNPPAELVDLLSNERQVTPQTPPAFLVHSHQDTVVPPENSLYYTLALRKAGVPSELHMFEKGQHGFGLALNDPDLSAWPRACEKWLGFRGYLGEARKT